MSLDKLVLIQNKLRKFYGVHVKRDRKQIAYHDYLEKGGEALRLDYPLGEDALVIDAGGYHGDFAADMICKYDCKVDVFEPVERYAEKIRNRFLFNSKVNVVKAGLGASEKDEYITIAGLGSSVFEGDLGDSDKEKIRIISAVDYILSKDYSVIGLMKINIEGGEYELLQSLFERPDLVKRIRFFQIQFHDFVPGAQNMRAEIRKKLSETHNLMWDFPFIWESWGVKQK